jgi:Arc/MetJ family transcription regulator
MVIPVRTNIVIDDDLLAEALEATGAKSKREVVELGLAMLVKLSRQERVKEFRGKLRWQGDLDAMRDSA